MQIIEHRAKADSGADLKPQRPPTHCAVEIEAGVKRDISLKVRLRIRSTIEIKCGDTRDIRDADWEINVEKITSGFAPI